MGHHLKSMRAVLGSDGNICQSQIIALMTTTWWPDNETGQIPSNVSAEMLSSDWGRIRGKANVWALRSGDWTSQLMGKLDSIDPSWSPSMQTSTNYSQSHKTKSLQKKKVIQTCLATKTSKLTRGLKNRILMNRWKDRFTSPPAVNAFNWGFEAWKNVL